MGQIPSGSSRVCRSGIPETKEEPTSAPKPVRLRPSQGQLLLLNSDMSADSHQSFDQIQRRRLVDQCKHKLYSAPVKATPLVPPVKEV